MIIKTSGTIVIAILVLYLGKFLNAKVGFLRTYNIPEPVTGGFLASLIFAAIFFVFDLQIDFTLNARDTLLIIFFTTIGLAARFNTLLQGGKALVILVVAAVTYLFLQNVVGLSAVSFSGLPRAVGLLGGSISLSGGHGTVIAWSPTFVEKFGISNAMEIGLACSTFGLVLGGIIGGPIAKFLIQRHKLTPPTKEELTVGQGHKEHIIIDYDNMIRAILAISLSIGIGLELNHLLLLTGVRLPDFVTALFGGILVTNILPMAINKLFPGRGDKIDNPSIALVSDVSLGLFLSMSLMSLQLWTIIDLALPIIFLLFAQLVFISFFAGVVIFYLMGRDYDAAVIAGGYAGLGLGATPTAIANMTAITKQFGGSPKAFLVVPLVGAFFIDITNTLIIQFFLERV